MASPPPYADPSLPPRERALDLVARLSPEQKLGLMCSRQEAVPALGLKEFHIGGEAAHGLQSPLGPATMLPQTIGLASTWDEGLLEEAGSLVGDQARAYSELMGGTGGLCLWAPTVDMERDPRWGRTEEGYGEDPLLAGRLSSAYVRGIQGPDPDRLKAVATPKHFYGNNNEEGRCSSSSSILPRLRREYYLKAFEPALSSRGARAASMMTAYNAIDGVPAIFNPELGDIVRAEWGFEGFVVCDAGSLAMAVSAHRYCPDLAHAAALAVRRGVDNFTEDAQLVKPALREALGTGLLAWSELDRAVARTLEVRIRLGQLDQPRAEPREAPSVAAIWSKRGPALALRAAREAIVLLKNEGEEAILPLDREEAGSVAVIGPLAEPVFRDWYSGTPPYSISPLAALAERLPEGGLIFEDGCDIVALRAEDGRWVGRLSSTEPSLVANRPAGEGGESLKRWDWGQGNVVFRSLANGRYLTSSERGIEASAAEVWGWYVRERFSLEKAEGRGSGGRFLRTWDSRLVGLGSDGALLPGEGGSPKTDGLPPSPEELRSSPSGRPSPEAFRIEILRDGVSAAAAAAAKSRCAIVFVGNHPLLGGKEEIDRADIGLPPEQERLIAAVAAANPRTVVVIVGSYPFAFGPWADKVAAIIYTAHGGQEGGRALAELLFGETNPAGRLPMTWYASLGQIGGILDYDIEAGERTYRYFKGKPLFPFGHGLSYSRFAYNWAGGEARIEEDRCGGKAVEVRIENLGSRDGDEVVQLYAASLSSAVSRPLSQLMDFKRLAIPAGETVAVTLKAKAEDFGYWDEGRKTWTREEGDWELRIGSSSSDIRLRAALLISGGQCWT
jgi:beta-glucosidase